MPIHDWTGVSAGTRHDFHVAWIIEIRNTLNGGLLPPPYYAQAEQFAGPLGPDVLTLQSNGFSTCGAGAAPADSGMIAVATAAPAVRFTSTAELEDYALKRRTVVIRHSSEDRIVALLEILSPGNKSSRHAFRAFVDKAVAALYHGFHLLLVDLFPPSRRDPQGIHAAIWSEISDAPFQLPPNEPLTLAAYSAGPVKQSYVEPTAVGRELMAMPLFLEPEFYINVPLEPTYQAAYRGVARRWKEVLESSR